ncbi:mucin-19 isoform X1 [Betta splendens]|uniref:Mucin-19 isoform X1 n=1 Tax=Betta splendens TaxID=158456 RepID=A0A8M1HJX4_BETSP|nr:mucin-19 isoform X1 [Betta splendens]
MLPQNLLVLSVVVLLATTISTAPLEEKEQEEVEVEATEEGELSEEEDDDDSQSQDKIEGGLSGRQTTTVAAAEGSVPSSQSAGGAAHDGTAGGSAVPSSQSAGGAAHDGTTGSSAVPSSQSAGGAAHDGTAGSSAVLAEAEPSGVSTGLSPPTGTNHPVASSVTEANGSESVDSESNGNGQKLLNGGGGGGRAESQTGVLDSFGGVTHLDYIGTVDPSSHDFLLGLMGGGDPFSPDVHINIPVVSSGVTAAPYPDQSSSSSLDVPAGPAQHISQLGPDQSQHSSASGFSHSADQGGVSSSSSHSEAQKQQTDGADSPDAHGNGRQTHLVNTNAVTDQPISHTDPHTDLTGGAVTSLQVDLTASIVELSHDITDSSPAVLHADSVDTFTGVYGHADLVTVATDLTGRDRVSDPTGRPMDYSHPAVTEHTQTAGPVTEQFNTSGQGPEGAENVELEDTC